MVYDRPYMPTLPFPEPELEARFTFHPVSGDQGSRYEYLRSHAHDLATIIVQLTPQCREQSVALTKLQEVVMWANAAIAIREDVEFGREGR